MNMHRFSWIKIATVVVLTVVISACSGKIAYNNADLLVRWYIAQYVDLNEAQRPIVKEVLQETIEWHRDNEIPRYLAQLNELKSQLQTQALDEALLAQHQARLLAHWQRVRDRLAPPVSQLAMTLDIDQMSLLFVKLKQERAESVAEFDERVQQQPSRAKRILENMEESMGYVTPAQQALVEATAPKLKPTFMLWQEYQAQTQQAARSILVKKDIDPNAQFEMFTLLSAPEVYRSDEYENARARNQQLYLALFSAIVPTLETAQIDNLVDEIDEYIELLEDIAQG